MERIAVTELAKQRHLDPFAGDSRSLAWTRPVHVGQLQAEVEQSLGAHVRVAVCGMTRKADGSPAPVDESAPLTVFVTPSSVDVAKVGALLGAHRPDPKFGRSPAQAAVAEARAAISAGKTLTLQQLTVLEAARLGIVPGSGA